MSITPFDEIDYTSEGLDRVTQQFKDDPVYQAYLKIVLDSINSVQTALKDLKQLRSLDTATGKQLDMIGTIIGQSRTLVDYNAFPYFGFNGSTGAETFGTIADSSVGGVFRSYLQEEGSAATVDDETYRFLIRARIIANTTRATPEAVIAGINFITQNTNTTLVDGPNAHITIEVMNTLTDFQKYFLQGLSSQGSIIPIPISVSANYVYFEEDYFGFFDDPLASPLIGIGDSGGGYISSLAA